MFDWMMDLGNAALAGMDDFFYWLETRIKRLFKRRKK